MISTNESLILSENKLNRKGLKGIITSLTGIFIALMVILISAGKLNWINGWIFFVLILGYELFYIGLFLKINPELINKRGILISEESKFYDKIFAILYLPLYYFILVISGIDVRYELTIMPLLIVFLGVILFLFASILSFWAMYVNSYFECTVRIQKFRKQEVVTNGPYKIVRHPGYIAGIITTLVTPLILGSLWGIVPSFILVITLVIRTYLEDSTLQKELPGYKDYSLVTQYRLVPFIW
jgi:protein-S-isoprenylcysteine O-methyltransferase Ste14